MVPRMSREIGFSKSPIYPYFMLDALLSIPRSICLCLSSLNHFIYCTTSSCQRKGLSFFLPPLTRAQNDLDGKLIELLIVEGSLCERLDVKGCLFQFASRLGTIPTEQSTVGLIASVNFLQEPLNFRVGIEALGLRLLVAGSLGCYVLWY